jgi:hypothetical protein
MSFSSNLRTQKKNVIASVVKPNSNSDSDSVHTETYRGQILEKEDNDDDGDDEAWHVGKLKFRKHIDDAYRVGSDGHKLQDYTVIDPTQRSSGSGSGSRSGSSRHYSGERGEGRQASSFGGRSASSRAR